MFVIECITDYSTTLQGSSTTLLKAMISCEQMNLESFQGDIVTFNVYHCEPDKAIDLYTSAKSNRKKLTWEHDIEVEWCPLEKLLLQMSTKIVSSNLILYAGDLDKDKILDLAKQTSIDTSEYIFEEKCDTLYENMSVVLNKVNLDLKNLQRYDYSGVKDTINAMTEKYQEIQTILETIINVPNLPLRV